MYSDYDCGDDGIFLVVTTLISLMVEKLVALSTYQNDITILGIIASFIPPQINGQTSPRAMAVIIRNNTIWVMTKPRKKTDVE